MSASIFPKADGEHEPLLHLGQILGVRSPSGLTLFLQPTGREHSQDTVARVPEMRPRPTHLE